MQVLALFDSSAWPPLRRDFPSQVEEHKRGWKILASMATSSQCSPPVSSRKSDCAEFKSTSRSCVGVGKSVEKRGVAMSIATNRDDHHHATAIAVSKRQDGEMILEPVKKNVRDGRQTFPRQRSVWAMCRWEDSIRVVGCQWRASVEH